jgi:hypothetical protein
MPSSTIFRWIDFEVMFLDGVIGRRGMAIELSHARFAKNII